MIAAARLVRQLLGERKLRARVKTTGGKGLHVVVPIAPADGAACHAPRCGGARTPGRPLGRVLESAAKASLCLNWEDREPQRLLDRLAGAIRTAVPTEDPSLPSSK